MLFEYAVEPKAIGSNWKDFKYLIEKFGFDRGRLISRFPKKWERDVIEVAQKSGMGDVRLKSLVSRLQQAKTTALISSRRNYDPSIGDWLENALLQQVQPFHAIIASENRGNRAYVLVADEIDETDPLMVAPNNWEVPRVGADLASAMAPLLRSSKDVLFIDRYFDIQNARYTETLKASLAIISASGIDGVQCEIHYGEHDKRPPLEMVEHNAGRWLAGVIPAGMSIKLFGWREKAGGADFHARFLLTDRGGMNVEAGFSADGAHQKVLLALLEVSLHQEKMAAFARHSTKYELIEPVLEIFSDGRVRRI
ncbi:hypothetical protein JQ608_15440 [Bradyrhizobium liaoningense]|uniref:hypothetical protein n=1 Tax=Bradyrhizobium liaoningense TaxID=43992 RepID=UPI001BA805DA|nr:hypothetical protein [Bradyrhizobium liaoningense]MBR0878554.1 hypothetical protein [Bradyrhizobium liaoningense]